MSTDGPGSTDGFTEIEWDAEGMRARNNSEADQYIRRDYRKGFSIHG